MKLPNIIGVVFMFAGLVVLATCGVNWSHCNMWIAGMGCLMMVLGALMIDPDSVTSALKSLVGIASPIIPTGGRRATDPTNRPPLP